MDATVTVTAVEEVGPHTHAIRFESPPEFAAEPGQFVKLGTEIDGELEQRFYTLSSSDVTGTFEVTVGIDPEESGPFSEFLAGVEPGDEMELSGPFGNEHYEGEGRVVVLAGGPGIGPAVGIAERAVEDGNDAAIVYRDDEPAHEARIGALRENGVEVHLIEAGSIDDAVAQALTGRDDEQVFVYGFADFLEEAEAAVAAAGGDFDAAKVENFG